MIIVPITGILAAKRSAQFEYFTSILYPIVTDESVAVSTAQLNSGNLWSTAIEDTTVPVPSLLSGTLVSSIVFKTYNEPLAIENTSIPVPTLQSGTLVDSIVYKTYNEPLAVENTSIPVPTLVSGTLAVTINYVNYNQPLAVEDASIPVPTLLSGTLL